MAKKSAGKSAGLLAGIKVRLIPKYVIDHEVRNRTPEQRQRLAEMEREKMRVEREAESNADLPRIKMGGLGGARRPAITPPSSPSQSADE